MNIVWLIGNGFDLACGLNTRYSDFYKSSIVANQKGNLIYQAIKEDVDNWSDFELKLGEHSKEENLDLEKFLEGVKEVYSDFKNYIYEQENRILNFNETAARRMNLMLKNFPRNLTLSEQDKLWESQKSCVKNGQLISSAINFNYTNVFLKAFGLVKDEEIEFNDEKLQFKKDSICHIHGSLEEGVILGCDNSYQYSNILGDRSFYLDKQWANQDTSRKESVLSAERKIKEGDIYILWGLSIGKTDQHWWNEIMNEMARNRHKLLIVYYHSQETPGVYINWEIRLQVIDSLIGSIYKLSNISEADKESIKKRIIISSKASDFSLKDDVILNK